MKKIPSAIPGFGLIVLSWIFWGLIIVIPFLKLGIKRSSLLVSILFAGTNIFWVGVMWVGKEMLQKYNVRKVFKRGLSSKSAKGKNDKP